MNKAELRDEINKRLTLNWLIQGAAQHAGMTAHHLARDEMNALDPRLLRLYDKYALVNLLQYWHLDAMLIFGWPPLFWRRARRKRSHPFYDHPLLSAYGGMLAAVGRKRALDRCREKGLTRLPIIFGFQTLFLIGRLRNRELPHRRKLIELAKKSASTIWGIPIDRLDADLRMAFFGTPIRINSFRSGFLHTAIVGLGGVVQVHDRLKVVGRGTNWQLLTKELVKGTAELICLHGLNDINDETYHRVVSVADRLDLEPWMLQTGGELWRRLLALTPKDMPIAEVLMHMARLPAPSLEALVRAVIEKPEKARNYLTHLDDVRQVPNGG